MTVEKLPFLTPRPHEEINFRITGSPHVEVTNLNELESSNNTNREFIKTRPERKKEWQDNIDHNDELIKLIKKELK